MLQVTGKFLVIVYVIVKLGVLNAVEIATATYEGDSKEFLTLSCKSNFTVMYIQRILNAFNVLDYYGYC